LVEEEPIGIDLEKICKGCKRMEGDGITIISVACCLSRYRQGAV
jgi:hypothetical protein